MKNKLHNRLAAYAADWKDLRRSLITLRDMIELYGSRLFYALEMMRLFSETAALLTRAGNADAELSDGDRTEMLEVFSGLHRICADIGLHKSKSRVSESIRRFSNEPQLVKCSQKTVCTEIEAIRLLLMGEMGEIRCVVLAKETHDFYNRKSLFGKGVSARFPSARRDITDAGNCLALGLGTAAVFHLMRAIEFGLRELAVHLKIGQVKKRISVEFATWEEIITALSNKIGLLSRRPRGNKRQADLDFYNGMLIELRAIKDFWRNKVMHTRADYDEHQAMSAYLHTRAFMQRLAERISE